MNTVTSGAYTSRFAHGLMFHRFHKSGTSPLGQGSLTDVELDRILNFIGKNRVLTPQEWLFKLKNKKLQENDVCITFDDGLKSQLDVALPVLDCYGIKAFWFVFSSVFNGGIDRNEVYNRFATTQFASFDEFVEEFFAFSPVPQSLLLEHGYDLYAKKLQGEYPFYSKNDLRFRFVRNKILCKSDFESVMDGMIERSGLNVPQIARDIWLTNEDLFYLSASGHTVGLHSYDHPFAIADLPVVAQEEQYLLNCRHINQVTGKAVECVSHPLNSYSADTLDILLGMGIVCGFRANMSPPRGKAINGHPLELAREDGINILRKQLDSDA